ncbi:MAG: adaptor protein MecA [Clostridia bacterium]|nr:adaptor protein MecA [Clostridia bacterium]
MRIERLSENKIKIVVEAEDVRAWNVDLKNFTDHTPEAQNMFHHVLRLAERDLDFRVEKAQLMVETATADNNGFVLVVSKLENEKEFAEALVSAGKRIKQVEFKIRRRPGRQMLRIFRFGDFEALCSGVREIFQEYIGESRLMKYQGEFFLELSPADTFGLFKMENTLSEFAEKVKDPVIFKGVLGEHGLLMIEKNAVECIARYFR